MKQNPYSGLFIDIEGLDGSGASTQVAILKEALKKEGVKICITKEPTDNVIGGLIRGALTRVYELPPATLQLLFVADRLHHLDRQIIPILQGDSIVVSDRFLWSTIAFGSTKLSRNWLLKLHQYCFIPDLSIFLRISPKLALSRIRADRFDFELFEEEKKLQKTWDTYEWLAKKFPEQIIIVDASQPVKKVAAEILSHIKTQPKFKKLEKKKRNG